MVPSLFISHGSPMLALEDNEYTQYLQALGQQIKPKAIVLFTAHWESEVPTISFTDDTYEMIYDFYGFPKELFKVQYPAKGSTAIAAKVEQLFKEHGIDSNRDTKRGLDHGSWVVLRHLYPNADIPVVQISVNAYLSPEEQFKIGAALRSLGQEDILIIGSGGTSHNLRMVNWHEMTSNPEPWTEKFDDWIIDHLQKRDLDSLYEYEKFAPNASLAVPRPEHFIPLFITLGSGEETNQANVLYRSYQFGTLSHIVFEF